MPTDWNDEERAREEYEHDRDQRVSDEMEREREWLEELADQRRREAEDYWNQVDETH